MEQQDMTKSLPDPIDTHGHVRLDVQTVPNLGPGS